MTSEETPARPAGDPRRGASALFTLIVGFLIGVLAANLLTGREPTVVIEGGGTAAPAAPSTSGTDPTTPTPRDQAMEGSADAPGDQTAPGVRAPEVAGPASDQGTGSGGASQPSGDPAPAGDEQPGTRQPAGGEEPAGGDEQPSGNGGATERGVTADSIHIGVGVLDIGALRNLGPEFDNGNIQEHMQAWLEGVRRDGLLPINGRDLKFSYRRYEPASLDTGSHRSACTGFVDDDQVFAVIAGSQFTLGGECVAREKRTPVITSDSLPEESYERSAPFLYTLQPSTSTIMRNWAHWMQARGLLDGATIGVYHFNNRQHEILVYDALEPELERLGQKIEVVHTTDQNLGGPQDAVAVNRFQRAGVDLALILTSKAGFQRQAQNAGYNPTYADTDWESGTSNTATSQYPPEQWDRTMAMTSMRWGEWVSDIEPTDPAKACVRYYEEKYGRRVDPNEREAEWVGMNKSCDSGWALLEALRLAGPNLTHASFAQAMQDIQGLRLGVHLDATFGPGRYHSDAQQRTLEWHAECECWTVLGFEGPLWVD